MKIAYNNCFGGFGLSHAGVMRYAAIKGIPIFAFVGRRDDSGKMRKFDPVRDSDAFCVHYCTSEEYSNDSYWSDLDIERHDPALIQTIEELREDANGRCAQLAIEDVPAGTAYRIDEYDGNETVATKDSYDWKIAI